MTRPNILLIHSDQHRYDCVGANGHSFLQTPSLDRLASEGMRFTHAFCPNPLCSPARASFLTGQWTSEHLLIANGDTEAPRGFRDGLDTWSEVLQRAGYWLGYIGKWHAHPDKDPTELGFGQYISQGRYNRWREEQNLGKRPMKNGWFGETDEAITPGQSRLAWGADLIIELMQERSATDTPWVLRWDPEEPHLPNVLPEPYASMYNPEDIPPWPGFGDTFEGKPHIQAQQLRTWGVDGWTWEQWAPVVARYLGEITLMDAQIGRILQALEQCGQAENTLVVYTTDHGDMCGSHGMIDKHFILYDDVTRVPMIARWPGRINPGSMSDAFVCNGLDLATTFCEVADAPVPETFRGESLMPLFAGTSGSREDIFSAYHGNQFGLYSQRMVRDRRWKYVFNATAEDELYDLEIDPGELINRATDPACAEELARLRQRLMTWMEQTHDRLLNNWTRAAILRG